MARIMKRAETVEGGLIIETHVDPLEPSRVTMLH